MNRESWNLENWDWKLKTQVLVIKIDISASASPCGKIWYPMFIGNDVKWKREIDIALQSTLQASHFRQLAGVLRRDMIESTVRHDLQYVITMEVLSPNRNDCLIILRNKKKWNRTAMFIYAL